MSCRHQLGQKSLNMHQGELYGYSLYLIKHHMLPQRVKFVYADVMCKLYKFVKRLDPDTARKFTGALSVMHAKGHGLDCQVCFTLIFFVFSHVTIPFAFVAQRLEHWLVEQKGLGNTNKF